jgi:hypothetical protein
VAGLLDAGLVDSTGNEWARTGSRATCSSMGVALLQ